jgi:teichuronic acid biosynthesis glycosyltransferase TuaC
VEGIVKVLVVSEFYPRRDDPVLGVWAHRQALAAREAGAEMKVIVLHRLVPPRASFVRGRSSRSGFPTQDVRSSPDDPRSPDGSRTPDGPSTLAAPGVPPTVGGPGRALRKLAAQPHQETLDGVEVTYVRYVSPPRAGHYHAWGAWAAPALGLAMRKMHRSFRFDLVHAHNAVPSADAVRRALGRPRRLDLPLIVSVHGGDVLYTAPRSEGGRLAVERNLAGATDVLANSAGIAELARRYGARQAKVVHLGAEVPESVGKRDPQPSLVTVGHLIARKRHADVLKALAVLSRRHPTLRYAIVGDGPERIALEGLAARLGVRERVHFHGQLPHEEAIAVARRCTLFAMPSTEEAFGVAYIEAMAGGVPAIGCRGEPGPEEIAAAGDGFVLVPPGDIERLTQRIDELLSDPGRLREASMRARETVASNFSWRRCGEQTVAAYEQALR